MNAAQACAALKELGGVLGLTFKEDVPDLRNTRVVDIIHELTEYDVQVMVHDPYADPEEARQYYGLELHPLDHLKQMDAVIIAVKHETYKKLGPTGIKAMCADGQPIIVDVKCLFTTEMAARQDVLYWQL